MPTWTVVLILLVIGLVFPVVAMTTGRRLDLSVRETPTRRWLALTVNGLLAAGMAVGAAVALHRREPWLAVVLVALALMRAAIAAVAAFPSLRRSAPTRSHDD